MNKWILAVLALGLFTGRAQAGFFDQQADAVFAKYVTPAAVVNSTAAIVIDKSDTTSFPHDKTGHLRILSVDVSIDQVAAGTSTVKVGVLTGVNASSGTVSWFHTLDNTLNVSNTQNRSEYSWIPAELNARATSAGATAFISNDKTSVTPVVRQPLLFQSDVALLNPTGTEANPAIGDIVAEIQASPANGAIVSIGVVYYSVR